MMNASRVLSNTQRFHSEKRKTTGDNIRTKILILYAGLLASGALFFCTFILPCMIHEMIKKRIASKKDFFNRFEKNWYVKENYLRSLWEYYFGEEKYKKLSENYFIPPSDSNYTTVNTLPENLQNLFFEKKEEDAPIYFSYAVDHKRSEEVSPEVFKITYHTEFFSKDLCIGFNVFAEHLEFLKARETYNYGDLPDCFLEHGDHFIEIYYLRCHKGDVTIELIGGHKKGLSARDTLELLCKQKNSFIPPTAKGFFGESTKTKTDHELSINSPKI